MIKNEPYILLFDGVCNLCNGLVQFIIKRDRKNKFKFASLQSESGQALLKKFNLPTENFDSLLLIKGDHYYQRSYVVIEILKVLGGFWKLFYAFIVLPAPLRDFVYNIVAKNRYKIFGRRDQCMIPTSEIQNRFLP